MPSIVPTSHLAVVGAQPAESRHWKTGQILHATVVSSSKEGKITLDFNGKHILVSAQDDQSLVAGKQILLRVVKSGNPVILSQLSIEPTFSKVMTEALRNILPYQTPLQGLFSNQKAKSQLFDILRKITPEFKQLGKKERLLEAITSSGVFLENRLLSGSPKSLSTERDLKGILLRQLEYLKGSEDDSPASTSLLRQLEGAIARIQMNQLSAIIADRLDWLFEIPFKEGDRIDKTLLLRIEAEDKPDEHTKHRVWTVSLTFELESLGPLHITLIMIDRDRITIGFWSERSHVLHHLDKHREKLKNALKNKGLNAVHIGHYQGKPKNTTPCVMNLEQRLLDISV